MSEKKTIAAGDLWRHVKRGSVYVVVNIVTMQSSAHRGVDMAEAVLYRAGDGRLWVRPLEEFLDGRFVYVGADDLDVGGWRPVMDVGLPASGERVQIVMHFATGGYSVYIAQYVRAYDADADVDVNAWLFEDGTRHPHEAVSHWRPLPDLPKQE